MGRETQVPAKVGSENATVKVLLETHELILRGPIKRRFPRSSIAELSTSGPTLRFVSEGELVILELGERAAMSWAKAIQAPAPTLREKLGLGQTKVLFIGTCDDEGLENALQGSLIDDAAFADLIVARVERPEDLAAAHAVAPGLPIWIVYTKGKDSAFGETAIRNALRSAKYRDTKICTVSDRLTALRFSPI